MATQAAKFTPEAANNIKRAAQLTLGATKDGRGPYVKTRTSAYTGFFVKITGNVGTTSGTTAPYHYAWTEQYDSSTSGSAPTLADKAGGRTGTTTAGYAVNAWEASPGGTNCGPVPNNTYVWIELTFDATSPAPEPVYRFNQPPSITFPVTLTSTSGGNATSATGYADYTYNVFCYITGVQLASNLTPVWARPMGLLTGPAANGFATCKDGELKLLTTDEQGTLITCT